MVTAKRWRPVERLAGTGEVVDGQLYIATVKYQLQVGQQVIVVGSFGGAREEHPGLMDVAGSVDVIDGCDLPLGSIGGESSLTLRLKDGRSVRFVVKVKGGSRHYEIIGNGPLTRE